MESNKTIKMSVSAFLLIFAIFVIIIMAFVIYNLYNEKITSTEKVSNANIQTNEDVNSVKTNNTTSSNEAESENDETKENMATNEKFVVPSLTTGTMKKASDKASSYSLLLNSKYYSISIEDGIPYIRWYTLNDEDADDLSLKNWAKQLNVTINSGMQKITGFTKQVVDVHIGGIGQDFTGEVLIFQMEDGTIEYSTIKNMMQNVSTQGKIEGLNNIVKLQDVNVYIGDGGNASIIAIDKDNNCYDLDEFIEN